MHNHQLCACTTSGYIPGQHRLAPHWQFASYPEHFKEALDHAAVRSDADHCQLLPTSVLACIDPNTLHGRVYPYAHCVVCLAHR